MTSSDNNAGALAPLRQLTKVAMGYWYSNMLFVAVKLKISDHLAGHKGGLTAAELARQTNANPDSLFRLLRALASIGLYAVNPEEHGIDPTNEVSTAKFILTPSSQLLRTDTPGSMYNFILSHTDPAVFPKVWLHLEDAVRTGKPPVERVLGSDYWSYLENNREFAVTFHGGMQDMSMGSVAGFVGMYGAEVGQWPAGTVVCDVGGGTGTLLRTVLKQNSGLKGVLLDLPSVIEQTRKTREHTAEDKSVLDRLTLAEGSFFDENAIPVADVYMMKHIIHDWDDERCLQILRNLRKRVRVTNGGPTARLVIMDVVVPPIKDGASLSSGIDMHMLVLVGARERTEAQFATLLEKAGWRLKRALASHEPTRPGIVEAFPQ